MAHSFADLDFKERSGLPGIQARCIFSNGYGASVIRGYGTYGADEGLYELAVVGPDDRLCYDTPVTSDVEGHLSEADVTRLLGEIAALPERAVSA